MQNENRDKLTGLRVFENFGSDFQSLIVQADNEGLDLSLIMGDIDCFSAINKEHGHEVGDKVLQTVAKTLTGTWSSLDNYKADGHQAYRYSGDMFAMLLLGIEKEQAFLLAEHIRRKVAENPLWQEINATASMSLGVAAYRDDGNNIAELVRKAEGALYRAKTSGRNKTCLAKEEKMVTKTSHYTVEQLQRLSDVAKERGLSEAILLREALDNFLKKHTDNKAATGGKRVIIVDDAAFMRMLLKDLLTKNGYSVVGEAADGKSGLAEYERLQPDIVILDIAMPEMDGIAMLKQMKNKENCRIIMVSAMGQPDMLFQSIENGADYFVVKPFQPERVLRAMALPESECCSVDNMKIYRERAEGVIPEDNSAIDVLSQAQIDAILKPVDLEAVA